MHSEILVSALVVLALVAGCAHAPRVVPVQESEVGDNHHWVFYSLPRADVEVAGEATLKVFTPGPHTAELEKWSKAARCSAVDLTNRNHICYWRFRSKRPPFAAAAAACRRNLPVEKGDIAECRTADDLAGGSHIERAVEAIAERKAEEAEASGTCDAAVRKMIELSQEVHLTFASALPATTAVNADPMAQFAIDLDPGAFEKLQYELAFAADGALTDFKATSTNTVSKVTAQLLGGLISGAGVEMSSDKSTLLQGLDKPLQGLVNVMVKEDDRREAAYKLPNPAPMLADIDLKLAALRELAEGRLSEESVPVSMESNPDDAMIKKQSTADSPQDRYFVVPREGTSPLTAKTGALLARMNCADLSKSPIPTGSVGAPLSLKIVGKVAPLESSRTIAQNAGDHGTKEGSLRYRVPVLAAASATLECGGMLDALCAKPGGATIPIRGELIVPQWGPTLATPRTFGWAGGSVTAKLDAKTGVLLAITGGSDDSLAGTLINGAWQRELEKKKAEANDGELSALQREQAVLEAKMKICAAQASLGRELSPDCPRP